MKYSAASAALALAVLAVNDQVVPSAARHLRATRRRTANVIGTDRELNEMGGIKEPNTALGGSAMNEDANDELTDPKLEEEGEKKKKKKADKKKKAKPPIAEDIKVVGLPSTEIKEDGDDEPPKKAKTDKPAEMEVGKPAKKLTLEEAKAALDTIRAQLKPLKLEKKELEQQEETKENQKRIEEFKKEMKPLKKKEKMYKTMIKELESDEVDKVVEMEVGKPAETDEKPAAKPEESVKPEAERKGLLNSLKVKVGELKRQKKEEEDKENKEKYKKVKIQLEAAKVYIEELNDAKKGTQIDEETIEDIEKLLAASVTPSDEAEMKPEKKPKTPDEKGGVGDDMAPKKPPANVENEEKGKKPDDDDAKIAVKVNKSDVPADPET